LEGGDAVGGGDDIVRLKSMYVEDKEAVGAKS
jgi:hypothetical protein